MRGVIPKATLPVTYLPNWDGPEMPFPGLPPSESPAPIQVISQGARGGRGWAWAPLRGRMSAIQVPGVREGSWCPLPALRRRGWVSVHLQCSCRAGVGARAPWQSWGLSTAAVPLRGLFPSWVPAGRKRPPALVRVPGPRASTQIPQSPRSGGLSFPPGGHSMGYDCPGHSVWPSVFCVCLNWPWLCLRLAVWPWGATCRLWAAAPHVRHGVRADGCPVVGTPPPGRTQAGPRDD